jgi:hypothetical protein
MLNTSSNSDNNKHMENSSGVNNDNAVEGSSNDDK